LSFPYCLQFINRPFPGAFAPGKGLKKNYWENERGTAEREMLTLPLVVECV